MQSTSCRGSHEQPLFRVACLLLAFCSLEWAALKDRGLPASWFAHGRLKDKTSPPTLPTHILWDSV